MYTVAICDDMDDQIKYVKEMCEQYFNKYHYAHDIICFKSGKEVLQYKGSQLLLLFLDIELGGEDGISIMHKIIDNNNIWRIVFISSHSEEVFNTFGLKTLDFGVKPVPYAKIERWLSIAIKENLQNEVITFEKDNPKAAYLLEDIIYLQADGNYIKVITNNSQNVYTGNLKYWQNNLDQSVMVRVHKSYIINLDHVKNITNLIEMDNGEMIFIGRKYKEQIKQEYKDFIFTKIRGRV